MYIPGKAHPHCECISLLGMYIVYTGSAISGASDRSIQPPCIMCVQYRGGVQYRVGCHEYRGDILSTIGGVQYRGGIPWGHWEIPWVPWGILSAVGILWWMWGVLWCTLGEWVLWGIQSFVIWVPPQYWTPLMALLISPTVLMISPTVLNTHYTGCSTALKLIDCTNNWKLNIGKRKILSTILLDITKAFVTINHDILLQKLRPE